MCHFLQVLPKYDMLKYDQISDLKQIHEFWHAGVQVTVWRGIVEGARLSKFGCFQRNLYTF